MRTKIKTLEKTIEKLNEKLVSLEKIAFYVDYQNKLREKELEKKSAKTGFASIDKPWLKFYPEEALTDKPNEYTLYQQLKLANQDNLEDTALSYQNESITFAELFQNIDRVADALVSLGITKGDIVTICLPNIPEFVYSFYAISKIGAIASLIEPRTVSERIKLYVNSTNSKVMIMLDLCKNNIEKMIHQSSLELVISVSAANSIKNKMKKNVYNTLHKPIKTDGKYLNWNDFLNIKRLNNVEVVEYTPNTIASIVYTSGTTGIPKGAALTNETYNGQNMQLKYSGICPKNGDIFLGNIPFFSAYGSSSGMHNALTNGVQIALIPSYKPTDFPELLYQYRPNHVMGVPRFYEYMSQDKKSKKRNFSFLDNIISGGDKMAPVNEKKINKFMKEHGAPNLKKGLGMSEFGGGFITTISSSTNKIGSVGIPHVGNNVMIVDPNTGKEIPYGNEKNVGELYVTGPTMMHSYYNNKEETEKFFYIDENGTKWAKTGDLVYMDQDGVVFFVDRIKNVLMRPDGHTVPLLPIENAICKHPSVLGCAAVGVPVSEHETGALPMAFILLKQEDVDLPTLQKELEDLCEFYIPERDRPEWYRFVSSLPYNLGGKVDLIKLKEIGMKEDLNIKYRKCD